MSYRNSGWGLFFILGALVGGILALLLGTDEEGETKPQVKDKVKSSKVYMKDVKEKTIDPVVEVFEEKSREARKKFYAALDELNDKLVEMKGQLKNIDTEKYTKVVDAVIADLKKSGDYTSAQLKRLKNYFINDYEQITASAKKEAKKA